MDERRLIWIYGPSFYVLHSKPQAKKIGHHCLPCILFSSSDLQYLCNSGELCYCSVRKKVKDASLSPINLTSLPNWRQKKQYCFFRTTKYRALSQNLDLIETTMVSTYFQLLHAHKTPKHEQTSTKLGLNCQQVKLSHYIMSASLRSLTVSN